MVLRVSSWITLLTPSRSSTDPFVDNSFSNTSPRGPSAVAAFAAIKGRVPTRERGRPARNLIPASSLRSGTISSHSAPNPPLRGSFLLWQVLCGRDARAPGWGSPATLFLQTACGPGPFPRTVHQTGLCRDRFHRAKSYASVPPGSLFLQAACDPRPLPRAVQQTCRCGDRFHCAKSCAGETPALPGGRSAWLLIPTSRLRSTATPSHRAPNPPLRDSFPLRQVLCGQDARVPGWVLLLPPSRPLADSFRSSSNALVALRSFFVALRG